MLRFDATSCVAPDKNEGRSEIVIQPDKAR
jgi:hypothetical protein